MNNLYCDLKALGTEFNNKPLYKCDYCGITVGLENIETKILCFKKLENITQTINNIHSPDKPNEITHIDNNTTLSDHILSRIENDSKINNSDANLCSEEQIEQRMSICRTCEFYQNNSCLQCGCVVVREANHMNKLAHKNQKCPIDKWDIIS